MIKRIRISGLRGIRQADLKGLGSLVILVGANGSGKSTILEACFIAATRTPAVAVGMCVHHRATTWNGARWLLWKGGTEGDAEVSVELSNGETLKREVHWDSFLVDPLRDHLSGRRSPGPYSALLVKRLEPPLSDDGKSSVVGMGADNAFAPFDAEAPSAGRFVRFVEPLRGQPLHDLYSRVVQAGRKAEVIELTQKLLPGATGMELLTEDGEPRLFVTFEDRAVPATLSSDGNQALFRLIFEIASPKGAIVLLEEPELHQHPANLQHVARVVLASARSGNQVILTTHSLDLVDRLVADAGDDTSTPFFSLIRTKLTDGKLATTTMSLPEVVAARRELDEDLR